MVDGEVGKYDLSAGRCTRMKRENKKLEIDEISGRRVCDMDG